MDNDQHKNVPNSEPPQEQGFSTPATESTASIGQPNNPGGLKSTQSRKNKTLKLIVATVIAVFILFIVFLIVFRISMKEEADKYLEYVDRCNRLPLALSEDQMGQKRLVVVVSQRQQVEYFCSLQDVKNAGHDLTKIELDLSNDELKKYSAPAAQSTR